MPQPEDYAWSEKRHWENICHTQQQTKKVPITPVVVVSDGDEPLDWGTNDGASQASVNNNIAKVAGFSEINLINYFDNDDPDSYKDPNFHRQVNSFTITQEEFNSLHKQLRILVATVDSLSSDCNNRNQLFACNSSNCVKCKDKKLSDLTFLCDSGTSQMFTSEISDFSTDEKITNGPQVQTTDKRTVMCIVGKETVFITHEVKTNSGEIFTRSGALHPVYIPRLSAILLSVRSLLAGGLSLRGDKTKINFYSGQSIVMTLKLHMVGQTIYWLNAWHTTASNLVASSTIHEVNYDLMHCQFGHPSKEYSDEHLVIPRIFHQEFLILKMILSVKDVLKARCLLKLFPSWIVKQPNPLRKFMWTWKACLWFHTISIDTLLSFMTILSLIDGLWT